MVKVDVVMESEGLIFDVTRGKSFRTGEDVGHAKR